MNGKELNTLRPSQTDLELIELLLELERARAREVADLGVVDHSEGGEGCVGGH